MFHGLASWQRVGHMAECRFGFQVVVTSGSLTNVQSGRAHLDVLRIVEIVQYCVEITTLHALPKSSIRL